MAEEKKVKKKVSPQVWKFYQISGSSLVRSKKECPRCGRGVFLADHADRLTCGKCSYVLFKKKQ
jgi:small subunit ribosomal protein S27Ae